MTKISDEQFERIRDYYNNERLAKRNMWVSIIAAVVIVVVVLITR